jgi:acetyl esterase/lipase
MPFAYHPDLATAMAALAASGYTRPTIPRGDWKQLRETTEAEMSALFSTMPLPPGISTTDYSVPSVDGATIRLRWFVKEGSEPGSAAIYVHGSGMIMCNLDLYTPIYANLVAASGVPILGVDFRNAPDVPGSMPAEDTFAALTWLIDHAGELGVDPARIAIMGESGGGGIAAGTTVLARDRGVKVTAQILICPMLDDRNVEPDPFLAPFATWSYDANDTAWIAVLGEARGSANLSPVIAPARLTDCAGLPPTYIDTNELDIFRDEDMAYAMKLLSAGIHVDFHLYPGVPHGWEGIIPNSELAQQAMANRVAALHSF